MGASNKTSLGALRRSNHWRRSYKACQPAVRERSDGQCEVLKLLPRKWAWKGCTGEAEEFHHRLPIDHLMANEPEYVMHVCKSCHLRIHRNELAALRHSLLLLTLPHILVIKWLLVNNLITPDEIDMVREGFGNRCVTVD